MSLDKCIEHLRYTTDNFLVFQFSTDFLGMIIIIKIDDLETRSSAEKKCGSANHLPAMSRMTFFW